MFRRLFYLLTLTSIIPSCFMSPPLRFENTTDDLNEIMWNYLMEDQLTIPSFDQSLVSIEGKSLKVVIRKSPVGMTEVAGGTLKLANGSTVYLDGSGIPVLWDLRDSLNLNLDIILTDTWTEAWDMVEEGNADLGATLRTIEMHLRAIGAFEAVIMLHPVISTTSNVYFRRIKDGTVQFQLIDLLDFDAWIALFICWVLVVLTCHIIHRFPKCEEGGRNCFNSCHFSISETLLWTVTIASGKDYPSNAGDSGNYPVSLRIAIASAFNLTIIMMAVYTANFVVLFSRGSNLIKTPEDLIKFGFHIGSFSRVHIHRLFHEDDFDQSAEEAAVNEVITAEKEELVKKVLGIGNPNYRYAFLTHSDGFYAHDPLFNGYQAELCEVIHFESAVRTQRSMYLKKGSIFKELLNLKTLQFIERGTNYRYQKHYLKQFEYTCHKQSDPVEKLSIQQTFFAFLPLLIGISFALIVGFFEFITPKIIHRGVQN